MMPLTMAKAGETIAIQRITGKDEVRQHLAELGFIAGAEVQIVSENGGSLIVHVHDARVALDKAMANRVQGVPVQSGAAVRASAPLGLRQTAHG